MHARTKAALEKLEKADWFVNVGKPHEGAASVLTSWKEAVAHCGTIEWENFELEGLNQYPERLCEHSPARFNKWNEIVEEVKQRTMPFLHERCEELIKTLALQVPWRPGAIMNQLEAAVQWDILGACMETEYADVWPPGFFGSLAYWYINGHFPCGWQGPQAKDVWDPEQEEWVWQGENPNLYPPGFYDKIATWYETGFGDWQGQIPEGKLIVY